MARRVNDTTTHLLDDRGLLLLLLMGEESRCFFVAYVLRSWLDSLRLGNVSSGKNVTTTVTLLHINQHAMYTAGPVYNLKKYTL